MLIKARQDDPASLNRLYHSRIGVDPPRSKRRWPWYVAGVAIGLVVILLAGCANTYLDVSTGPQIKPVIGGNSNWQGSGPVFELGVRKHWDAWFCQYAHTSNLGSGWPMNGDQETTLDRVTCGRSFRLD